MKFSIPSSCSRYKVSDTAEGKVPVKLGYGNGNIGIWESLQLPSSVCLTLSLTAALVIESGAWVGLFLGFFPH